MRPRWCCRCSMWCLMSSAPLYRGDCLAVLASMEPESVDAIVCDPPYGLGFMGKAWDYDVPDVEVWK